MKDVKLSICIPTYNREIYIRNALEYCEAYNFSFSYEIIVSDNASTDATGAVVAEFIAKGLPIRYFRREVNGGSGPNLANAFHHAVGEYSVYLADDDLLVVSGVEEAIRHLDQNPEVVACHAPWNMYDEVEGRDLSQFYAVEEDRTFDRQDFFDMFRFIFEGHIFPEIAIYRSSALRSCWVPREYCFWAFSYLAHFLDQGAVTFLKQPFYRSVAVSKLNATRQQAGHDDVMTSWDKYRGGLEYYLHIAAQRGVLDMSEEACAVYEQMCRIFTLIRMSVAIRFWYARKDYITAYELCTRMVIGGQGDHPEVVKIAKTLPTLVGLQTLAYQVNATSGICCLVIGGMADPDYIAALLYETGLSPQVVVIADTAANDVDMIAQSAVFIGDEVLREEYEAKGYQPNLIFSELELTQHVLI
ncbi:glycosyltransferase family 2 protein [Sphingobium sufflavum]|uniref:glycosyltransferase family 2 protein n=1 Tax=Sphingobium sufflavum TaxID=1129547 RepID=UPI001F22904D|nr:glycosyltransferase family A protein [Sphingobium sufflavum]MCE7795613.1 glycosyltransferase family 2 protein [Sphingobium sufflavum]